MNGVERLRRNVPGGNGIGTGLHVGWGGSEPGIVWVVVNPPPLYGVGGGNSSLLPSYIVTNKLRGDF